MFSGLYTFTEKMKLKLKEENLAIIVTDPASNEIMLQNFQISDNKKISTSMNLSKGFNVIDFGNEMSTISMSGFIKPADFGQLDDADNIVVYIKDYKTMYCELMSILYSVNTEMMDLLGITMELVEIRN